MRRSRRLSLGLAALTAGAAAAVAPVDAAPPSAASATVSSR